jgi:hypothetical protein
MNELTQQTDQLMQSLTQLHRDLMNLTFALYLVTVFIAAIMFVVMFRKMK